MKNRKGTASMNATPSQAEKKKEKNRHFKHAKKILNWKGQMTNDRANIVLDEIADGMKETMPKHIVVKGVLINLHDCIA